MTPIKQKPQFFQHLVRRNKYNAVKTKIDGIFFDSKKEAARYGELKLMQRAGEIRYFHRQVPFDLPGGVVYKCDFMVIANPDTGFGQYTIDITYEDVKGFKTPMYRLKKKQVETIYGIKIIEK